MKKYIVTNTQPCWVTWSFEVQAENEDEAMDKRNDGVLVKMIVIPI